MYSGTVGEHHTHTHSHTKTLGTYPSSEDVCAVCCAVLFCVWLKCL